jgi:GAF domain-containing protein
MDSPLMTRTVPCTLEAVIVTEELDHRPPHHSDSGAETKALVDLAQKMATDPQNFFAILMQAALELSGADSTGISVLDENEKGFNWPAIAGKLKSYIGEGTPRDFGPCGTVLDRQAPVLFSHPERHFTYLASLSSPLEEVLLIPFFEDGKAVGTIWAVIHSKARKFDAEDKRLLMALSSFAASAYRVLTVNGAMEPIRRSRKQIQPSPEN